MWEPWLVLLLKSAAGMGPALGKRNKMFHSLEKVNKVAVPPPSAGWRGPGIASLFAHCPHAPESDGQIAHHEREKNFSQ